jgi:DNA polymerase V
LTAQVLVFIRTSPFRDDQQYSRSIVVPLRRSTADTGTVVQAAMLGLQSIFRPGFKYAKAGVMLLDLNSDLPEHQQGELDLDGDQPAGIQEEKVRLMSALDAVNQRYGKGTLKIGSAGFDGSRSVWAMKQERRTPGYTTCLEEIAVARA